MAHRLLLADDSVTIQKVIELTFADEEIDVTAVSDGDQAITRLEVEPFDIVLADIGMPGKDGFEVAAFVKARPALAHVPVILLTGAYETVDDARVIEVGASAVLAKPFDPQVLVARVRGLLRSVPGARPPVATRPAQETTGADASAAASASVPVAPPSVDDYFERLDRAFANLNVPLEARDPMRPPARQASQSEALSDPTAAPIEPAAAPVVSPEHTGSSATATPIVTEIGPRAESPSPVAPVETPAGLAQTFATLLAVEQGELPPSALATPSGVNEDKLVDRIARRVVEQMGDRAVRDLAADIVSRTAERLVREEIDRIKAGN
jgi:DNA-binding response OmpR family regulator